MFFPFFEFKSWGWSKKLKKKETAVLLAQYFNSGQEGKMGVITS